MSEFPLPAWHWTPREEIVLRLATGRTILWPTPEEMRQRHTCMACRSGRCMLHMTIGGIPATQFYRKP